MIYFLHIPKTAGSSLRQIIEANYGPDELKVIGVHWTTWLRSEDVLKRIAGKPRLRAIHGHFSYGLHRDIGGEAIYVTFLREPQQRVISGYFHLRRHSKNPLRKRVENMTLEEYLDSGLVLDVDNGMVRRISGIMDSVGYGEVRREHLSMALANLRRDFLFVGMLERFDASIYLLGKTLQWRRRHYSKERQGTNRSGYEPSENAVNRLHELNAFDEVLYEHVSRRLTQAIQESDFNARRFHFVNRLYNVSRAPCRGARKARRKLRAAQRKLFGGG